MTLIGESDGLYRVEPIEEVVERIPLLRQVGYVTTLVSNNDRESLMSVATTIDFAALFDSTVFSSDAGAAKPSLRMFEYVLWRTGATAEQCLFIDDVADNVDAAETMGMQGLIANKPGTVVAAIESLLKAK